METESDMPKARDVHLAEADRRLHGAAHVPMSPEIERPHLYFRCDGLLNTRTVQQKPRNMSLFLLSRQ